MGDLLFSAVGVLFAGLGFHSYRSTRAFLARAHRVPGVVVDLSWSRSRNGGTYHPVLRFQTLDGRTVQATSDVGSRPAPARPGQAVTVLYDPENPQEARLDTMTGRGTLLGVIFMVIGALVAIGGVAFLIAG